MRAVFNSDGRVEAFEDDDDAPSSEQFLPPYWPQYRQLSDDELEVVYKEAVKGNPDQDPKDIPKCNCDNCVPAEHETIGHLSFIEYITIALRTLDSRFAAGTLWNADIVKKMGKIKKQWKQI